MAVEIHVIRAGKGPLDPQGLVVRRGDIVHWVPRASNVKVKVKFKNNSPFMKQEMSGTAGAIVTGEVLSDAPAGNYLYDDMTTSELKPDADPVIIVRDTLIPKGKAAARKVARKR